MPNCEILFEGALQLFLQIVYEISFEVSSRKHGDVFSRETEPNVTASGPARWRLNEKGYVPYVPAHARKCSRCPGGGTRINITLSVMQRAPRGGLR
jgi:hypothetical protein